MRYTSEHDMPMWSAPYDRPERSYEPDPDVELDPDDSLGREIDEDAQRLMAWKLNRIWLHVHGQGELFGEVSYV